MPNEPTHDGWEYKVFRLGPSSALDQEKHLAQFGAQGWELVMFQPSGERAYPGEGTYTLKRPIRREALP